MNPKNLIGKRVVNLYERVTMDLGGLDQGEVFLSLDTGEIISFPYNLEYQDQIVIATQLENAESIYEKIHEINTNWMIKDMIEINNSDSLPYIELESGFLFTEETISPHGTGLAGFRCFENLTAFEAFHGTDYYRLSEKNPKF